MSRENPLLPNVYSTKHQSKVAQCIKALNPLLLSDANQLSVNNRPSLFIYLFNGYFSSSSTYNHFALWWLFFQFIIFSIYLQLNVTVTCYSIYKFHEVVFDPSDWSDRLNLVFLRMPEFSNRINLHFVSFLLITSRKVSNRCAGWHHLEVACDAMLEAGARALLLSMHQKQLLLVFHLTSFE